MIQTETSKPKTTETQQLRQGSRAVSRAGSRAVSRAVSPAVSPQVSRLITIMRFPQIVLVILRHNAGMLLDTIYGCGRITAAGIFVTGLGGIFAYSALLLMFFLSGYLFWSREYAYRVMLKKKVKGLLLPYLIWNTAVFFFYLAGAKAGLIQNLGIYLRAGDNPLLVLVRIYTGWGAQGYPAAYPLWYMRDLMLLMLVSPLLAFCMKRIPVVSLTVLTALWAFVSTPFFSVEGMLLFCLGWYVVQWDRDWAFLHKLKTIVLVACYLISMGVEIVGFVNGRLWMHKINVLLGSLVFLKVSSLLLSKKRVSGMLAGLSAFSFCIYLFHEPLLSVTRTAAIALSGSYTVLLYLFVSALVILLCMMAGWLLQKLCPGLYRIFSGGR